MNINIGNPLQLTLHPGKKIPAGHPVSAFQSKKRLLFSVRFGAASLLRNRFACHPHRAGARYVRARISARPAEIVRRIQTGQSIMVDGTKETVIWGRDCRVTDRRGLLDRVGL